MIRELKDKYRFMSNFWPAIVSYDGMSFPSVEHAYVAAKTTDRSTRVQICHIPTAGEVKRFGRKLQLRKDWESIKLDVMEDLVRQKFKHPKLRAQLLETGNEHIQEGNHWNDTFWGVCRGRGENHLGKILMKIRQEIQDEQV